MGRWIPLCIVVESGACGGGVEWPSEMNVLVLGGIERVDGTIDTLVDSVLTIHSCTQQGVPLTLFMSDQLLDCVS